MARLNDADRANLERIMKSQLNKTGWNFYNERQHVETLFYNRFNFFLMLYGMFVAAIASLECDSKKSFEFGLLMFTIVILSLVWATLCRNYQTLRMILYILDNGLPEYHSSPILSSYMKLGCLNIPSSGYFISIFIPFVCLMSLYGYLWYIIEMGPVDIPCLLKCIGLVAIIVSLLLSLYSVGIVLYRNREKKLKESFEKLGFNSRASNIKKKIIW